MTASVASKYFTQAEMACRDGTPYPHLWADRLIELFQALDTIREAWGGPLVIVSGYRTPEHNTLIHGAELSQHVEGRAVDMRPYKKDLTFSDIHKLHSLIIKLIAGKRLPAVGGLGSYPLTRRQNGTLGPGWVHVDTRRKPINGHIARWEGAKFGDEQIV